MSLRSVKPPPSSPSRRPTTSSCSAAIADRVVRRPPRPGLRVRILGPLEARLDRKSIASCSAAWSKACGRRRRRTDAWLSRPMRHELGLDLPERRIGLSAHDFAQLLGAPEVILDPRRQARRRADRRIALHPAARRRRRATQWQAVRRRAANFYLGCARDLDHAGKDRAGAAPGADAAARRAAGAAAASPRSSTGCAIPTRSTPSTSSTCAARCGRRGARRAPTAAPSSTARSANSPSALQRRCPPIRCASCIALGRTHFAAVARVSRSARASGGRASRASRAGSRTGSWHGVRALAAIDAEIEGEISIPLGERVFKLRARADRIERQADGRYVIIDYKTGSARTEKQVRTGLAPQLTLEAAILRKGGFAAVPAGASVAELAYVLLKGAVPAGQALRHQIRRRHARHTGRSRAGETHGAGRRASRMRTSPIARSSIRCGRRATATTTILARVKEWSATGGPEDEIVIP